MSNRSAFVLIAALVLLILFSAYLGGKRQEISPVCSTHSPFPRGLKALYLFLRESRMSVVQFNRSLQELPLGSRRLLVIAEPSREPVTTVEARSVLTWIKQGNFALVASRCGEGLLRSRFDAKLLEAFQISCGAIESWKEQLLPERISLSTTYSIALNQGVRTVSARNLSETKLVLAGSVTVLQHENRPVAILLRIGKGALLFLATSSILENSEIGRGQNLQFIWNFFESTAPTMIYFDEYHHGFQEIFSALSAQRLRALSWTSLQLVLLLLLFLLMRRSRLGPARQTLSLKGRSALETIVSLAYLFLKGGKLPFLCKSLQQNLKMALHKKYHLAKDFSNWKELVHSGLLNEQESTDLRKLVEFSFPPGMRESLFLQFCGNVDFWRKRLRL